MVQRLYFASDSSHARAVQTTSDQSANTLFNYIFCTMYYTYLECGNCSGAACAELKGVLPKSQEKINQNRGS